MSAISKGKVMAADKVDFLSRSRGSKYDLILGQIAGLDEGQVLVLDVPDTFKGEDALDRFSQGVRAAVKGRFHEESDEPLLAQFKFKTRKTSDGRLAVFWKEIVEEEA